MMWRRMLKWVLLIALCATFGLLDALRSYAGAYVDGHAYLPWHISLRWDLTAWTIWIAFIPLVFRVSERWPLNRSNWLRLISGYALLGFALATAKTFFPILIQWIFLQRFSEILGWLSRKPWFLLTDFLFALVFYGLALAFAQARNYYRRYREEELRATRLESQLAQAELRALRMQLQPHFLFNALNSISSLQLEDTAAAQQMTARLGDFLRLTLEGAGAQTVTLRREIEFLRCYLDIERVRFGRRLTTEITVAPDAMDAQVPNLILQPLVENAIRHGLAPRAAPGHISIRAARSGGQLRISIEDNGCGLKQNGNGSNGGKGGLGLANTRARLRQFYGEDFQFDLTNAEAGGLAVALTLPFAANGGDSHDRKSDD
ncbi:MAG: histidine kinase [Acidobacteriota bacterium]|nr:histidine kinase [Acidobacteriota bacterium]